ncbi:unnamed protein product [Lactuca virosa]|uniref:Potassium transporter n=1 Tax=Lactuca virosa TaxID=75947 RepID=A0AAU9NSQ7_9ASTR|nr:unnamed protein product [Lactuca virosa]
MVHHPSKYRTLILDWRTLSMDGNHAPRASCLLLHRSSSQEQSISSSSSRQTGPLATGSNPTGPGVCISTAKPTVIVIAAPTKWQQDPIPILHPPSANSFSSAAKDGMTVEECETMIQRSLRSQRIEMDLTEEIENEGGIWVLEQKIDQPMDEEAGRLKNMYREKKFSVILLLCLAFQSLGVVYGDLGTSPLYVFYN